MKVSAISNSMEDNSKRNFFIRYSNSFMSAPQAQTPFEKANQANNHEITTNKNKKMGIENLQEFTIFPKEVVDGRTVITA